MLLLLLLLPPTPVAAAAASPAAVDGGGVVVVLRVLCVVRGLALRTRPTRRAKGCCVVMPPPPLLLLKAVAVAAAGPSVQGWPCVRVSHLRVQPGRDVRVLWRRRRVSTSRSARPRPFVPSCRSRPVCITVLPPLRWPLSEACCRESDVKEGRDDPHQWSRPAMPIDCHSPSVHKPCRHGSIAGHFTRPFKAPKRACARGEAWSAHFTSPPITTVGPPPPASPLRWLLKSISGGWPLPQCHGG